MEAQKTEYPKKAILRRKDKIGGIMIPDFFNYIKTYSNKNSMVWA